MKKLFAIGFQGQILAIDTIEGLRARDVLREEGRAFLSPLIEVSTAHVVSPVLHLYGGHEFDSLLLEYVAKEYRSQAVYGHKRYGPFGDVIALTVLDEFAHATLRTVPVIIDYIAPKGFHKPGLAADLVVFVEDASEKTHFVGIKRRNDPGKGEIAPIGGYLNLHGDTLDSPLETVQHEAKDEAGITLLTPSGEKLNEQELLSREVRPVLVKLGVHSFCGDLVFVGLFPTSNDHNLPNGMKRVYWTFAYALHVRAQSLVSSEKAVAALFTHGDDADGILVRPLSDVPGLLAEFPVGHHRDLVQAACVKLQALSDDGPVVF